jgi:predicted ATPase
MFPKSIVQTAWGDEQYRAMSTFELDSITVRGFKSIARIDELALRSLNVLIGPNGSGKSNFIGVFAFLHALREGQLQNYVARSGGADNVLHFGAKATEALEIHISFSGGVNQYRVVLEPSNDDSLFVSSESAYYWDKSIYPAPYQERLASRSLEAGISDKTLKKTGGWVRERLARWRVYHFHDTSADSPMKKTASLEDNRVLRADGSNLAAFLYLLQQQHPAEYGLIRRTVQRVTPFFDDFELAPSALNPDKIRLQWSHKDSDKYFDASSLSDGTLRFISLATLLLQPATYRPSVILVDEPELGLHPYAITMLASLMKAASAETQMVISTQSPLLLDHFEPEDVLVASRLQGGTEFHRLETKGLEDWLEEFSLGQLWEKNEIGGRPQ